MGGRFSLGRLKQGSGYCVGAVVETRMGLENERDELIDEGRRGSQSSGTIGGNGMRDVWVIGEGFFRGVGGAFDVSSIFTGFPVLPADYENRSSWSVVSDFEHIEASRHDTTI